MHIPEEFYDFCLYLHQDFELYGPEPQDWINGAMRHMDNASRLVLKDYLVLLLAGVYSDTQLEEIYYSTDSEIRFLDVRELRIFLGMVRDTVHKNSIV